MDFQNWIVRLPNESPDESRWQNGKWRLHDTAVGRVVCARQPEVSITARRVAGRRGGTGPTMFKREREARSRRCAP